MVRRRENVPFQSDYKKYQSDLQLDFFHRCGYCGKHEMVSNKGMEPDHFVPLRIDPSRKSDYTNLVYSCHTCNHKKLGKWPTEDKNTPNDGQTGFVDPATEEFDKHLGRAESGKLEYYTAVGRYMYEKAFMFDIRPTAIIWRASMLYQLLSVLKDSTKQMNTDQSEKYIEIVNEFDDLRRYLFSGNE